MDRRAFFYSFWSLGILGLFLGSTVYGYSPFADGGRAAHGSGFYGPTHK
jgi:hypothetical protein